MGSTLSSFDLDTCKWVIWGTKRPYNTFGHIHEAFLRALKFLGKDAVWLENDEDVSGIDFSNTLFIALACACDGLPKRQDCFYVIHNSLGTPNAAKFEGLRTLHYGLYVSITPPSSAGIEVGPDMYYNPSGPALVFRWGTDLLPYEIEANKPSRAFNSESRVINFIGTVYPNTLTEFQRACSDNGIEFRISCGGVPIEDNIRMIRESLMAPAIQQTCHVDIGYVPCRLFKNISYGQFGITNSKMSNDLFGGRLIFNTNTYRLFHDAKDRLQNMQVGELHSLMDEVAAKHTYLNKIDGIIKTIRLMESK